MEKPDYEAFTEADQIKRRFRRLVFWFLISIGVLVAAVVLSVCVRLYFVERQIKQSIQNFDQSTSEAILIGKTPDQIIALFGKPYYDSITDAKDWPGKERVIAYSGPWGDVCRIEISGGVATKVEHYGK